MIITLFPIRSDAPMTLARQGAQLVINGAVVDLAQYRAGEHEAIIGQPVQDGAGWSVNLMLPHGACPPHETLFPAPLRLERDGPVDLPAYSQEPEVQALEAPEP